MKSKQALTYLRNIKKQDDKIEKIEDRLRKVKHLKTRLVMQAREEIHKTMELELEVDDVMYELKHIVVEGLLSK